MPCQVNGSESGCVTAGEVKAKRRVTELLERHQDQWFLFLNRVLRLNEQGNELDQIVVGPTGIFIIDVKSVSGRYEAHGSVWYDTDGRREMPDPVERIHRRAKSVRRLLETKKRAENATD